MHPCAPTHTPTETDIHTYIHLYRHIHTNRPSGRGREKRAAQQNIKLVGSRVNGRIRTLLEGGGEPNSMKQQQKRRLVLEIESINFKLM